MSLNTLWFILISVLFTGFFFLEGFDYGVGILLPFLGKDDTERRVIINTIGPFWDGNEVWLLTAGGAMFAAFPNWYATLFSGFYLALFLMLVALIGRGVAFEFRSKHKNPRWRALWDWLIFFGSAVPALLWGVALANIVRGVPIDGNMQYVGGFWNLLNPYALLGGLTALGAFTLHGAIFLSLRTTGKIEQRAQQTARRLWLPNAVIVLGLVIATYFVTDVFTRLGFNPGVTAVGAGVAILAVGWLLRSGRNGWAFGINALAIVLSVATVFRGLYPRVMISSLNPDWSLTVTNASSSPYTLKVMTIVAAIFVPVVLLYQGWTYWIFRKRVTAEALEY
ncbi:MAG: cytochrome d ubiquinol oxidase subunit II [Anaerolineae bacterium CG2_30_64_16]|nr:MAG: cytochrome d ubiquinol oxidase subunit II [Anaerolineae bacterium CG2_30_64_16]